MTNERAIQIIYDYAFEECSSFDVAEVEEAATIAINAMRHVDGADLSIVDYAIILPEELVKLAVEKGYPSQKITTAEQLCGWLREEHDIMVDVGSTFNSDYEYKGCAYKKDSLGYGKTYQWHDYRNTMIGTIELALKMI